MTRVPVLRSVSAAVGATVLLGSALVGGGPASASAAAAGASQRVIVLLRNQHSEAPATRTGMRARAGVVGRDQSTVRTAIARLGGRTTHGYVTLNAVAATVPSGALTALRDDPSVQAIVPDRTWRLSTPDRATNTAATPAARTAASTSQICPTDPSKPLLEPEALALTHTDSDTSTSTARALGYDGAGVKVGFIADGLDVDQPDFIRADGSHVITDYRDFSGDGTTSSTSGGEAFGDASSIAAQGRVSYDLADVVSVAHPLPVGCTIRVEGVAPGASMVALKVFSNALLTAPTSTIIQAIDWAVNVDHVDVLNESFGSNPYPDAATDPISLFNRDAVDAGVTVVASTGDAGSGNTMGTAATDPWVIGAGASTSEQIYAQRASYGFQLGNGHWTSDQPSSLSSGGISQTRRVQDLMAPGDLNWAVCSKRALPDGSPQYQGCLDANGHPSDLEAFGGTSEAAPLTAGAAALVIQAYRKTHAGASPGPQLVRQILDSSADDLGLPADQQGAGLLNSYRAVQLAASVGASPKTGSGLLLNPTQTSAVADPGAGVTTHVTVANQGVGVQRVTATLRQVSSVLRRQTRAVALSATSPTATFVDGAGVTRSYTKAPFTVPVGTDRLATTISWGGPVGTSVRVSLLDPSGTFSGYSLPQGVGNFGRIELHTPAAGTWTAIVWTSASAAGYTGPVTLTTTDYRATSAGTVSPASFTLAPGAHRRLTVHTTAPALGSAASSLVLRARFGQRTTASVVVQAVTALHPGRTTTLHGTFVTANGRDYSPGQTDTYLLHVPAGAPSLDISLHLAGVPANEIVAHLSDPSGEPISTVLNQRPDGTDTITDPGVQLVHARPRAGIWQLTLELANPVAGPLPQPYRVTVGLAPARVVAQGVPASVGTVISRRTGSTQYVTIRNTGPAPQTFFLDARSDTMATMPLVVAQSASTGDPFVATVALPLETETVPAWLVPTESTRLTVGAAATEPLTFDVMPLDSPTALNAPNGGDLESTTGTAATAVHTADPVSSALWAAFPTLVGPAPADGPAPTSATMRASVRTRTFYAGYTSSTGDPLLGTVSATAAAATPVTVPAGGQVRVKVRLAPTGALGSVHRGTLFVDTLQPYAALGTSGYADEYAAVPFAFTTGR